MFEDGSLVGGKYLVTGKCSDKGGMGSIVFVRKIENPPTFELVLKFCKLTDDESLRRFQREVRLMKEFPANSRPIFFRHRAAATGCQFARFSPNIWRL